MQIESLSVSNSFSWPAGKEDSAGHAKAPAAAAITATAAAARTPRPRAARRVPRLRAPAVARARPAARCRRRNTRRRQIARLLGLTATATLERLAVDGVIARANRSLTAHGSRTAPPPAAPRPVADRVGDQRR